MQIPDARVRLSELFATMEDTKKELGVEAYSLNQATLEQIFIAFTRMQYPPAEAESRPFPFCC